MPANDATQVSTAAVANELVELCRDGRNNEAIEKFYSEKIVSIEPVGGADMPAEIEGLDAVRGKQKWWMDNNEVHSTEVNGPFLGDGEFAVYFSLDTTFKPTGQRSTMKEMAKYTVEGGKIVKEEFFYAPNM